MEKEVIDLKEVLERVQDDRELLIELLEIFTDDCPLKLKAIREAAAKKDFVALKDVAHSMKGASGNISAKPTYAAFLEIEQMAKDGNLGDIERPLKEIEGQLEQLKAYARKLEEDLNAAS
ncbi:MAG TPA: Hpt domain-containing protein [Candidatus Omnitrophota bacterium]|nr:Hpt domain-containing protein [Candidatus Omnitrophota bacterium]HPD84192.1 Hpt domain-containing protein [Candidatus Omnitrophota bacterium]HRZ03048.1 Hpt domain-containing protein [Candidatus Omnitrophota bacterium]